jgi:uncharacterized protein YjbI with pentapeptide repeats
MLGLQFDACDEFGLNFSFYGCQLNHASFYKTKIKKTIFENTQLVKTDFTGSDLSYTVFANCNLELAIFDQSNLEYANFLTAYNYSINPEINRLKKTKFSINGISGLLDKYDIIIEDP